jgi:hypothetical protein
MARTRPSPATAKTQTVAEAEAKKGRGQSVGWEALRQIALALPETEEGLSYGTPAFRVRGKLFVRLHESGYTLVVRIDDEERAMRMRADPKAFFITDHYLGHPWVLVRLAAVRRNDLRDLLKEAWRLSAPKKLAAAFDGLGEQR